MTAGARAARPAARSRSKRAAQAAAEVAAVIDAAERSAVVIWRGDRLPYRSVPDRVAQLSDRSERGRLFASYLKAVEALNPLREERLSRLTHEARRAGHADLIAAALDRVGFDPRVLALELQGFQAESETVYFAALRRYLAVIDIEQGDATVADLWHLRLGTGWDHWFNAGQVAAAIRAAGGAPVAPERGGWMAAGSALEAAGRGIGESAQRRDPAVEAALGSLFASLLAEPEWLARELAMAEDELVAFADFAAFWRLWRARRDAAELTYELQLYRADDSALRRAYYAGIVGLLTGVGEPEASYLAAVPEPFAAGARLRAEMLAAAAGEALRARHGAGWWRAGETHTALRALAAAASVEDAVAQLGYHRLDWRPVLRQIRTQLIGEMSGYGGPNITTRAGTRKV